MKLEELKKVWTAHYEQAEQKLTVNKDLLKSTSLSTIKSHLNEFRATNIIELIINGVGVIYLMGFIASHWLEVAFAVPAMVLCLMITAHFTWNVYSLLQISSLHYGLSIIEIQKKVNTIKLFQGYQVKSLYVAIPLFALCFAVILPKALFGFSIYPYLGVQWYYHLLGTIAITPVIVWFVNRFPDKGVMKAQQFLADIVKFEQTEAL